MRTYVVNKIEHPVFESMDEVPHKVQVKENWRDGRVGEWVLSDDGCVVQILRKGKMLKAKGSKRQVEYIGTCTGTFVVSKKTKLDTSRRKNIYSFSGNKSPVEILEDRENLTPSEVLFVQYLAGGMNPQKAYMKSFPTGNPNYASMKAGQLIKTERVRTAMKEELKPVLKELDIDEKLVLAEFKTIATNSNERTGDRLKALTELSDIMDLKDKNATKVQQVTGVAFQGFLDSDLDKIDTRKEITDGK